MVVVIRTCLIFGSVVWILGTRQRPRLKTLLTAPPPASSIMEIEIMMMMMMICIKLKQRRGKRYSGHGKPLIMKAAANKTLAVTSVLHFPPIIWFIFAVVCKIGNQNFQG